MWKRGSKTFLSPRPPPLKIRHQRTKLTIFGVVGTEPTRSRIWNCHWNQKNVVRRLRSSEWSSAFHRTLSAYFVRGHLCWPFRHHWLVNCYLCVEILRAMSTAISMESVRVEIKIELGHKASCKKTPSPEGFTHDWVVFVRGPESCDISHFVEKVVFYLHESFAKPKRGKKRKNIY